MIITPIKKNTPKKITILNHYCIANWVVIYPIPRNRSRYDRSTPATPKQSLKRNMAMPVTQNPQYPKFCLKRSFPLRRGNA
jgi:hypothetical protein